ncbi:hypothetical protein [Planobispora longispora]|uniref:Uncharacterized protein n=1 Tax=Planobispora longispora TaxID=28887 RepID=A0A8J3RTH7_9ACTN|nr:hypothetical protein [Planobispora longispora]GIH79299.1 hypothetical protein Plo01_57280 [Planobispora longispora]
MRPVTKIATGFVFAFGALRFNGFDLLLDPVGWGLCVSGLSWLRRSASDPDDPSGRAGSFAVAMVCVSFVAMITPVNSTGAPAASVPAQLLGIAGTAGALITVWLIVDVVIRRMRPFGDVSRAALLDVLRWAVAGLGALGVLAGYGYAGLGAVMSVAWIVAIAALTVVLYRSARLPYLAASGESVEADLPPAGRGD